MSTLFVNVGLNVGQSYGGNRKNNSSQTFSIISNAIKSVNIESTTLGLLVLENPENDIYEDTLVIRIKTRESVFTENTMAELTAKMIRRIESLCDVLEQDAIAVYVDGVGGLLVGKNRIKPEWGYGVFNPEYFIQWERALSLQVNRFES